MTTPPPDLNRLEVLSGLNTGGALSVPDGYPVLGSGDDCDVVLLDDCVAPRHATVEIIEGEAQVVALEDGVRLAGQPLAKGRHRIAPLPFRLALNAVEIAFHPPQAAATTEQTPSRWKAALAAMSPAASPQGGRPQTRRVAWAAAAGLLVLAVFLIANPLLRPSTNLDTRAVAARPADSARSDTPRRALPRRPEATPEDVARAADKLRLDLAEVLPLLYVSATEDGVRVEGPLAPEDARRWDDAVRRFDARHAGRITVFRIDAGRTPRAERLPKIEAVWAGDRPYVVVDGARYFAGQAIEGGWTFEKLTANEIILARGSRLATVPY